VESVESLPVPIEVDAAVDQQRVGEKIQAALGGDTGFQLANGSCDKPCFSRSSFIFLKAASGISISPRTSKEGGIPAFFNFSLLIESGMDRTVRTLPVTSSPVAPSPRVTPRASCPFS